MSINVGNVNIPRLYKGEIPINKVYAGDNLVFSRYESAIENYASIVDSLGGNGQDAIDMYNSLPSDIRQNAKVVLMPFTVGHGVVYGMDNITGELVPFLFSRASQATLFNSQLDMELVGVNMPRIDYFNYGTNPKLLIEKVSTNLLIDSTFNLDLNTIQSTTNILNSVNWLNIIDKSVTIPPTGALPNTYFYKGYNVPAIANYSASAIVSSSAVPRFGNSTSEFDGRMVIVSASTTEAQTKIEHIKDTFYRISGSKEPVSAGTSKTTGFVKYSGNNSNDIKASAYQLELGTDSTSYIPTGSTAVTRATDELTYVLPTACSVYLKTTKQETTLSKPSGVWNIHNDLNNEGIEIIAITY